MIKKAKDIFSKLSAKQIVIVIAILVTGIWMIISLNCGIKIPLPSGGFIECGSRPADVKVDIKKKIGRN